jgi:hypothetical protein
MLFSERFTLPTSSQHNVDPAWFDKQKQRSVDKNDSTLHNCLVEEVDALRAFHGGRANPDETAFAITRPISTSDVPDHGGYSDGILALGTLWLVIITALIDWPSARTPDLFALLDAMTKLLDKIHRGQATDADGIQLNWNGFPYFAMYWPDDLQPGQICRQCPDEASLGSARRLYLRIKDVEAQLVAKHIMGLNKQVVQYIIRGLEKTIDHSDRQAVPNEAAAFTQVKLDFHIPAISYMFMYNGHEIYGQAVRDGMRDWMPRQMPDAAMEFRNGDERWSFWKRRLGELAHGASDDEVKIAAAATLAYMI